MKENSGYILNIANDPLTQEIVKVILNKRGHRAIGIRNAHKAIEIIHKGKPALILIDINQKEISFDKFSKILRSDLQGAKIPLFSIGGTEHDPGGIGNFASGTVNWLINPVNREFLLKMIGIYVSKKQKTGKSFDNQLDLKLESSWFAFQRFKVFMKMHLDLPDSYDDRLENLAVLELYPFGEEIGVVASKMAKLVAEFLKIPFRGYFNQDEIRRGILSDEFCKKRWVLPLKGEQAVVGFVLANPFDLELIDDLQKIVGPGVPLEIGVTDLNYLNIFLDNEEIDMEVVYPEGMLDLPRADWKNPKRNPGGMGIF